MFLLFSALLPLSSAASCDDPCWVELQGAPVLSPESRPMAFVGPGVGALTAQATAGGGAPIQLEVGALDPGASQGLSISTPTGGWTMGESWTLRVSPDCGGDPVELVFEVRADDDWEAPEGGLITDSALDRRQPQGDSAGDPGVDLILVPVTVAQDPGRSSGIATAAFIEVKLSDDAALMDDNGVPGVALLQFAQPPGGQGVTLEIGRGRCDSSFPDIDPAISYYLRSRSVDLSGNASRWSEGAEAPGTANLCAGCAQSGGWTGIFWPSLLALAGLLRRRPTS